MNRLIALKPSFFYQPLLGLPTLFVLPAVALLIGCQPKSANDTPPQGTGQANLSSPNQANTGVSHAKAQNAEVAGQEIAEKLAVSYARAAAYTPDECPKLVEFQFNNQSITRQDERFPKQTCDYFVYLRQGEMLKIDVSSQVKAELVSPVNFDFAEGSYTAPRYDKYTVRLSYDGTRFHPQDFKYDVILTKAKSKAIP